MQEYIGRGFLRRIGHDRMIAQDAVLGRKNPRDQWEVAGFGAEGIAGGGGSEYDMDSWRRSAEEFGEEVPDAREQAAVFEEVVLRFYSGCPFFVVEWYVRPVEDFLGSLLGFCG